MRVIDIMQYVRDYCLINGATGVIEAERQAADAKRQQSKEAAVESGRLQGERAKEILQNAARKRNKLVQLKVCSSSTDCVCHFQPQATKSRTVLPLGKRTFQT